MRTCVSMKPVVGLLVWLGVVSLGGPALAAPQTVTGKLINLYCYTMNKDALDLYRGSCGIWGNVRYVGMPVGVLTSQGRVFELAGGVMADNGKKIAPHLGKTVRVTGEASLRDGMPTITADEVTVVPSRDE